MYDYAGGKEDWLAAGREIEVDGQRGVLPIMAVVRDDVPTFSVDTPVGEAAGALAEPYDFVLVVDPSGIVLGKVLGRHLNGTPDDVPLGDVLVEGPTTVRANEHLPDLLGRMEAASTGSVIVTTPEGRLLGMLLADDARAFLEEQTEHDHHHHDHDH